MSDVRVTPWQDDSFPAPPPELLAGMKGRRPAGELIGIDRVLLRSFPLATGWNELLGRVRAEFDLALEYRELIMLRVAVLNRADFEWGVHHPAYLRAGGTEEKAEALKRQSVPVWCPELCLPHVCWMRHGLRQKRLRRCHCLW